ncbi:helix-turn-helix domain-containing protein [Streptomyces sp. NPDC089919]|uniref:AraC family transcriptional regulator n=1 Tax=Streptomyces sp. NPDC089919 TaxID=3155188 RepID=UPI00342C4C9D
MVSHTHPGTTSSALARLNVNAARVLGVPAAGYAHLLGTAPEHLDDDLCRVPTLTSIRLAELMTLHTPWPEVALAMTRQSGTGSLGVWDYLITSAPTPLAGIQDAAAHLGAALDVGTDSLLVTEDNGQVVLSHLNAADMSHEGACAVRACALGLYRHRLGTAARRGLVPLRVTLATPAPRRHDALVELYGTRAIDFDAPVSSLTFLAADLTAPTPHAQPGLSAVLRRHAERTLATATVLRDWLDLFRTALAAVHDTGALTLPAVARRMNLSARTLQRRLEEHGTTWSAEVEELRRTRITHLLHHTDLSVEAIAARSGYADARALRRAVHRWYGTTPAALRTTGATPAALRSPGPAPS